MFDSATEKTLVRLSQCATVQHAFISLISDSHTKDTAHFSVREKMYNSVVQHIATAHHVERQDKYAKVHPSDVRGLSGSIARKARSTDYEPNLIRCEGGTKCLCLSRTAMMKLCWGLKFLSSGKPHLLSVLKRGGDPGAIHRAAKRHTVNGEVQALQRRDFFTTLNT